jgi:hypothetical protein
MTRLTRFVRLPRRERQALIEAALALGLASLLVRTVGFSWIARRLGRHMEKGPSAAKPESVSEAARVGWAVDTAARVLPWKPVCLPQAIAATLLLKRRGIVSTLYLGVDPTRALDAHAWVRVGEVTVTGGPVDQRFAVVSTFARPG